MFSASKTGATGGYQIANSLRFRASASAYLSRTVSISGSFTLSLWVKRGSLGTIQPVLEGILQFNANDTITVWGTATPTRVFRDPSAWYHIVIRADASLGFLYIYVNNISEAVYSLLTTTKTNPRIGTNGTNYFDGYLADINFIDGQALTPTSFGAFDPVTGIWTPKKYSGSYGTNGFKLNFSNGTSTTTLGYDSSGRGNNWTTNGISLTSGSTYDWMIDSPTSFAGTSYGVGNYAVLNPLTGLGSLAEGNLQVTSTTGWQSRPATIIVNSGKYYAECVIGNAPNSVTNLNELGVTLSTSTVVPSTTYIGAITSGNSIQVKTTSADYWTGGTLISSLSGTYSNGSVMKIAINLDAGLCWLGCDSGWINGGNPSTGTTPTFTFTANSNALLGCSSNYQSASVNGISSANFGQRPFSYTPPTGFKSLCTYNLPTPTILNGAKHMAATTYAGNGSTQNITNTANGVSFQPDFVWVKNRTTAINHVLTDSNRGVNAILSSNMTNDESTFSSAWIALYGQVTAFNADGFSLSSGSSANANFNSASNNYVAWQWKAGSTTVSNTAGSITSQVRSNTTAGFSVVAYTGTGVNATVGHGLGVAPSMVIVKQRNAVNSWYVYHISVTAGVYLLLNSTAAIATSALVWNNTSPTSSVINIGIAAACNTSAGTYVAYCFSTIPGYSAFGSYPGNGSANGPFVYLGFRPRYLMVKSSSAISDWTVIDTARSQYNLSTATQFPNAAAIDGTGFQIDILSNGFKLRSTGVNTASTTYIYAAFAENPFQNALAR